MSCSLSGRDRFQALSAPEQARFRSVSQHLIRHAVASAVPIVFGHPPRIGNKIESASGCVLRLRAGSFVVTAAHVLRGYKEWLAEGEESIWQVGRLKFSPLGRIASSDKSADVAFLKVSEGEASEVGSSILSPSNVWPPPRPEIGQLLIISGYPRVARQFQGRGAIGCCPMSAILRVTSANDRYAVCEIARDDLVSFDANPAPDADFDHSGWSGAPALLFGALSYPIVGVVSEYQPALQLLFIATLESAMLQEV
jgi:hypothetical protein